MFCCCCAQQPEENPHVVLNVKDTIYNLDEEGLQSPQRSLMPHILGPEDNEGEESYYDVEISKEGAGIGLRLVANVSGEGLYVSDIEAGGPFDKYNAHVWAFSAKQVQPGDLILEVNGRRSCEAMMSAMVCESELKCKMFRPVPITINVNKKDKAMGLQLFMKGGDGVLSVAGFDEAQGAAKDYNACAPAGLEIQQYDYIASINSISGSAKKMVSELMVAEDLEIILVRVPKE